MHRKAAATERVLPGQGKVEKRTSLVDELFGCLFVVCVFLLLVPFFCECVYECEEGFVGGILRAGVEDSRRCVHSTLRNSDRLDDLEDCRAAHDEDEQRQQPRTDRVLLFGVLRRLGDVSALGDVAAGLLVGHADSLLRGHCVLIWGVGFGLRANHSNRTKIGQIGASSKRKLTVCALLFRL